MKKLLLLLVLVLAFTACGGKSTVPAIPSQSEVPQMQSQSAASAFAARYYAYIDFGHSIPNSLPGSIEVFDEQNAAFVKSLPVPIVNQQPVAVAADPVRHQAYAVSQDPFDVNHGSVLAIDSATNKITATIVLDRPEFSFPTRIALSGNGQLGYVLGLGEFTSHGYYRTELIKLDLIGKRVVGALPVGYSGVNNEVVFQRDPSKPNTAYVDWSDRRNGTIGVIDAYTNRVVRLISIPGGGLTSMALNPAGNRLYVVGMPEGVSNARNTLYTIDLTKSAVVSTLSVTGGHGEVVVSPDGRYVLVQSDYRGSPQASSLDVVDALTNTVRRHRIYPGGSLGIAYNHARTSFYMPTAYGNGIDILSPSTFEVTKTVRDPLSTVYPDPYFAKTAGSFAQ